MNGKVGECKISSCKSIPQTMQQNLRAVCCFI